MLAFRRGKDDLGSLFVVNLHGPDAREVVTTMTNPETPSRSGGRSSAEALTFW